MMQPIFKTFDDPGRSIYRLEQDVFSATQTIKAGAHVMLCGVGWRSDASEGINKAMWPEKSICELRGDMAECVPIHGVSMDKLTWVRFKVDA